MLTSILLRVGAVVWTLGIFRRTRDKRVLFLTLLFALMAARQIMTLLTSIGNTGAGLSFSDFLVEAPGLAVSLMGLLVVLYLDSILVEIPTTRLSLPRQLNLTALLVGCFAVIACFALGYIAYTTSRARMETAIAQGNLSVARTLGHYAAEDLPSGSSESAFKRHLNELWTSAGARYPGSYLCALNSLGTIVLHTQKPSQVGRGSGEVVLRPSGAGARTVGDLVRTGEDWFGRNQGLDGEQQLVGYTYIPLADMHVVVHTPLEFVESELRAAALPWAIGFALIGGLMIPLVIVLLHRSYKLESTRAAMEQAKRRDVEAQLERAERMEAIGRLAGGVAHDFNNLLTSIIGNNELARAIIPEKEKSRIDEYLAEVDRAGRRASELTQQLLTFSRKRPFQLHAVNLNQIVDETRLMLERVIPENIQLELRLSPELRAVNADAGILEQVLVNLVANARDAMTDGGRIVIETRNAHIDYRDKILELDTGDYAALVVSDNGQGMTQETLERIFEPFFTTKAAGRGTGLGLSTAYGVAQSLGGTIHGSSSPGRGTTFTVYLPCDEEAIEKPSVPVPAEPSRQTGRVLLIEDDAAILKLFGTALEDAGFEVFRAKNAETARRIAGECDSLDVVVSDVVLPDADGPSLSEQLVAQHPDLKVLFVSGYLGEDVERFDGLITGENFLQKPVLPKTLVRHVGAILAAANAPAR